jgi:hypothetical protein
MFVPLNKIVTHLGSLQCHLNGHIVTNMSKWTWKHNHKIDIAPHDIWSWLSTFTSLPLSFELHGHKITWLQRLQKHNNTIAITWHKEKKTWALHNVVLAVSKSWIIPNEHNNIVMMINFDWWPLLACHYIMFIET